MIGAVFRDTAGNRRPPNTTPPSGVSHSADPAFLLDAIRKTRLVMLIDQDFDLGSCVTEALFSIKGIY
jgi:hypothetical protein